MPPTSGRRIIGGGKRRVETTVTPGDAKGKHLNQEYRRRREKGPLVGGAKSYRAKALSRPGPLRLTIRAENPHQTHRRETACASVLK